MAFPRIIGSDLQSQGLSPTRKDLARAVIVVGLLHAAAAVLFLHAASDRTASRRSDVTIAFFVSPPQQQAAVKPRAEAAPPLPVPSPAPAPAPTPPVTALIKPPPPLPVPPQAAPSPPLPKPAAEARVEAPALPVQDSITDEDAPLVKASPSAQPIEPTLASSVAPPAVSPVAPPTASASARQSGGYATTTIGGTADADYKASYLKNPKPAYPAVAVRMRAEGRVVLFAEVLPDGRAGEVGVEVSSGYAVLDQAALQTVRTWRFTPARKDGKIVTQAVRIPIDFHLRNTR